MARLGRGIPHRPLITQAVPAVAAQSLVCVAPAVLLGVGGTSWEQDVLDAAPSVGLDVGASYLEQSELLQLRRAPHIVMGAVGSLIAPWSLEGVAAPYCRTVAPDGSLHFDDELAGTAPGVLVVAAGDGVEIDSLMPGIAPSVLLVAAATIEATNDLVCDAPYVLFNGYGSTVEGEALIGGVASLPIRVGECYWEQEIGGTAPYVNSVPGTLISTGELKDWTAPSVIPRAQADLTSNVDFAGFAPSTDIDVGRFIDLTGDPVLNLTAVTHARVRVRLTEPGFTSTATIDGTAPFIVLASTATLEAAGILSGTKPSVIPRAVSGSWDGAVELACISPAIEPVPGTCTLVSTLSIPSDAPSVTFEAGASEFSTVNTIAGTAPKITSRAASSSMEPLGGITGTAEGVLVAPGVSEFVAVNTFTGSAAGVSIEIAGGSLSTGVDIAGTSPRVVFGAGATLRSVLALPSDAPSVLVGVTDWSNSRELLNDAPGVNVEVGTNTIVCLLSLTGTVPGVIVTATNFGNLRNLELAVMPSVTMIVAATLQSSDATVFVAPAVIPRAGECLMSQDISLAGTSAGVTPRVGSAEVRRLKIRHPLYPTKVFS